MRSTIDAVLIASLLFLAWGYVSLNDERNDLIAEKQIPKWISVKFDSSTASVKCVMKDKVCDARL